MADHAEDLLPARERHKERQREASHPVFAYLETGIFAAFTIAAEIFFVSIYSVWFKYIDVEHATEDYDLIYGGFRDVNIMIFFGFGYLMTFPRRYGYSAVGLAFLVSAFVCQWSLICEAFFVALDQNFHIFGERFPIGVLNCLNGLFCAGSVMISFGAILGKTTPLQMMVLGFIEPFFYWLNIFVCSFTLDTFDIGGGYYIHIFGCYYGLSVCLFLTTTKALRHPDNISSYASDLFAFAGTLFLWMMWPSFNSVIGPTGIERVRGSMNTFISLCGSTVSTFVVSRIVCKGKFDPIHVQNAVLSGGVAMGVAAHLQIFPATALGCGLFIGVISTLGFKYLTPFLARFAHIHDTCGINNLHGMPGIFGALMSIFASWVISQTRDDYIPEYPHGHDQPLIQFAALGITLGIAILSGLATGIILLALIWVGKIHHRNYFHDREFWVIPYDYDEAATAEEEE